MRPARYFSIIQLSNSRAYRICGPFAWVTINPAHVLGVEDRVGTLREGKDADLILVKGRPGLDTDASVCKTMIDGKVIWQSVS